MNTATHPKRTGSAPILLAAIAGGIAAVLGTILWVRADLDRRMADLESAVHLFRFERTSQYEGIGFNALLEHLQYWSPYLQKADPGFSEKFEIPIRVRRIVATMASQPGAFDQITEALAGDSYDAGASEDETRKWLLQAAITADPERGRDLYARYAEAVEVAASPRLRKIAADQLFLADKVRAGEVLHRVLRASVDSDKTQVDRLIPDFIDLYDNSGHPEAEIILQRILGHAVSYDLITVQKCISALGRRKCQDAAETIMALFWQQAPSPYPNPLFRVKCLEAVAEILKDTDRETLRSFVDDVDIRESNATVRARLEEIKKLINE